jgi:hypothetical protein
MQPNLQHHVSAATTTTTEKKNLSSKHSIYPNCPAPKTEKKHTSTSKQNLDPLLSIQLLLLLLQTTPQKKWVPKPTLKP